MKRAWLLTGLGLVVVGVTAIGSKPLQIRQESGSIDPRCAPITMSHGAKTPKVVVFVHGFTTCPQQFVPLAKQVFDQGVNVYIPRLSYHGQSDKLTNDLAKLTAQDLVLAQTQAVEHAQSLGDQVTVVGLSGGGVMAAWAGQNKNINKAVIIAPNFAALNMPMLVRKVNINIILALPNMFRYWPVSGPDYAYPRYSTHALGEFYKLGYVVQIQAMNTAPKARELWLVTNQSDVAINREVFWQVGQAWESKGANVKYLEFEKGLNVGHDIIDIYQPDQQVDKIYPRLLPIIL